MSPTEVQRFGKYELVERIATGGMAEIWRARFRAAAGVVKPVVIKKVLPAFARDPSFTRMFIEEATLTAGLSHGNIAQVFDFGQVEGEYFLAMEFVNGQPLSSVLRRARSAGFGALPVGLALQIGIDVCRGLHHAHTSLDDQGRPLHLIHRDVSPQNVVISYEGQVKLVDFGIAKARLDGRQETEIGAVKGKFVYFSPEQIRGRPLDARVDVFATGVMLYEALCGKLPFDGKMADVLRAILDGDFVPPRKLNPRLPHSLERVLLQALATDREKRFPSARALEEALTRELYRTQPQVPPHAVGLFMGWLWEKELIARGHPIQVPREFVDWLERVRGSALPDAGNGTVDDEPTRAEEPRHRRRRARRNLWSRVKGLALPACVALLAGGLALAGVLHFGRLQTMEIRLTSVPLGAAVTVDGVAAPSPTPLRIGRLAADRPHRIEVQLPGHAPWVREVLPAPGAELVLHAILEAQRPESAPP